MFIKISPFKVCKLKASLESRGVEEAMRDIYEDKAFLHDLMEYTTETVIARCLAAHEIGVLPFIGDPSAGMSLISPDVYREHVEPYHRRIVDAVHANGGRIVFHICGFVDPIFGDLVNLGIDGLSIDAPSSLEKLFEQYGGKTAIIGNVDPILFVEGNQGKLQAAARDCLNIAGKEAKYMMGPGCQMPLNAKLNNVRAFTGACQE